MLAVLTTLPEAPAAEAWQGPATVWCSTWEQASTGSVIHCLAGLIDNYSLGAVRREYCQRQQSCMLFFVGVEDPAERSPSAVT